MYKNDWSDFLIDTPWLIKPEDTVSISDTIMLIDRFIPPVLFKETFPSLTELLMNARITKVLVNEQSFELIGWTDKDGYSFGWLCKPPVLEVKTLICKEHRLLLNYFGGITERWNEQEESWLLNLNSALTLEETKIGFQGWKSYVEDMCNYENLKLDIDPTDYIAFAFEANGNLTLYNRNDSSIIMFAPDHCFDHVTPLDGYPDYTLYRINNCPNFITWVETIAKQELSRI